MRLIALTGLAGSGKSTIADYLIEEHDFVRIKFARPLKEMIRALYREAGLSEEMIDRKIEGDLKRQSCPILGGKTPTDAMQTLGDEWGRQLIAGDLWVNIFGSKYRNSTHSNIIIDDCRYRNEARVIRELGGQIWRVVRRADVSMNTRHASETEQSQFEADEVIINYGSLLELYEKVERTLELYVEPAHLSGPQHTA